MEFGGSGCAKLSKALLVLVVHALVEVLVSVVVVVVNVLVV